MHEAASGIASPPLKRHELLWISPEAWAEALSHQPGLVGISLVQSWVGRGWPVVVRRRLEGEQTDRVPVAVPLPPSQGKRRLALSILWEGLVDRKAFLPLQCVVAVAPATWQDSLAEILALGEQCAIEPAVFGGLLWQHLTGLDYLTSASDLDLLWPMPAGRVLRPLLEGLAVTERPTPRLDGEIVLPDGIGINWRELWRSLDVAESRVLAKSFDRVRLIPVRWIVKPALAP